MAGYWKCSNKTPTSILVYTGLVDAALPPRILDNKLGILTQILIASDYHFFFSYFREVTSI